MSDENKATSPEVQATVLNDFRTFCNDVKRKWGSVIIVGAIAFSAGAYYGADIGIVPHKFEALRDAFNAMKGHKAKSATTAPDATSYTSPVPESRLHALVTGDEPAQLKGAPEPERRSIEENIKAFSKSDAANAREEILRYTTSKQEQLRIKCNSPEDGEINWQGGIETYKVKGVLYLKSQMHSVSAMMNDYKEKGYKCDFNYTAEVMPIDDQILFQAAVSDGFAHSKQEFDEIQKKSQ